MRIDLKEQERLELGNLYLKRYAILSDIDHLRQRILTLQQKVAELENQIQTKQDEFLKERGVTSKQVQPIFEDYELVALEAEGEKGGEEN